MSRANVLTIYRKELRDLLRDRRTIISMIVVPTLVIPLITAVVGFISFRVVRQARATVPTVMVVGGVDSPRALAALAAEQRIKTQPATDDWRQRISDKVVRAAVEIPPGFDAALERGEAATVRIYNYEGEMRSGFAVSEVRRFFTEYRDRVITARLQGHGLPATLVKPFDVRTENVAPPEKVGGNVIGGVVPYLVLLLCFTGAMYPAMDLTAGEKERGTMETILCSPVSRLDLVLGKFFMVLTASLGTVVCALISMAVTFTVGGSVLAKMLGGGGASRALAELPSVNPWGVVAVLGMVLPMAVLFSAVLLTISLFAKSFKEAQSYVSPLIVLIILPAVVGILPGVELNAQLALVPILNVSLVSKELVSGVWQWPYLALIFGSSCVYAAAALALAVRMFNREDVIFRT
ncbi:ABC transporter permease subunit [Horticoccus sp. 23ND18S-11]|uniref:ABC transporter permease subunit n=1 Tax=Horticoccus sp. 23ND18S-11 TaxID=3391832 RepID=UPI0039C8C347